MESLQLKPGEVIYKCPKCCCIKPERAHHCRYSPSLGAPHCGHPGLPRAAPHCGYPLLRPDAASAASYLCRVGEVAFLQSVED